MLRTPNYCLSARTVYRCGPMSRRWRVLFQFRLMKDEWFAYIFGSWRERSRLPNGHTVRMVVPKNGFPHCAGNSKVCCKCIYARLPFPSITVPCMSIRHDRDFKTRLGNDLKNTYRRNIEVKLWKGDVGHWLTLFSSTYLSLDWHIRSVFPVHFPLMRI